MFQHILGHSKLKLLATVDVTEHVGIGDTPGI